MTIKVSELFYSVQGEGRYMGVPSVFLRTFGCNFRCKKFNRDRDEVITGNNPDVDVVINNIAEYKTYESLPIVDTGCDTYAAIYPEFKHLSPKLEIDEIANRIVNLLPFGEWREEHLVITGGEPLLGWQRPYIELLGHPKMARLKEITFETNGTQRLSPSLYLYLIEWLQQDNNRQITFSVSAKLPCSGHGFNETIFPENIEQYRQIGYVFFKFVVANGQDIKDAETAVEMYKAGIVNFDIPIYLMPVGGSESVYTLNAKNVALAALDRGWRYSDRLQVPLFKNAWAT